MNIGRPGELSARQQQCTFQLIHRTAAVSREFERRQLRSLMDKGGSTSLDLSGRGLTSLPPELGQLTNLMSLNLSKNRLESPPRKVISQGTEAILANLRGVSESRR